MKMLKKALIASAIMAGLGASNAFAGTEACFWVYKGPVNVYASAGNWLTYGGPDCTSNALTPSATQTGSVAFELLASSNRNTEADVSKRIGYTYDLSAFQAGEASGLQIAYVPTDSIPSGTRVTFKLSGANAKWAGANQLYLLASDIQQDAPATAPNETTNVLRLVASSTGAFVGSDEVTFTIPSGISIPAGFPLFLSTTNSRTLGGARPVQISLHNDSCTRPNSKDEVFIEVVRFTNDLGSPIQSSGVLTTQKFKILEATPQHFVYHGAPNDPAARIPVQSGTVNVLTRELADSQLRFLDLTSDAQIQSNMVASVNGTPGVQPWTGDYRVDSDDFQRSQDIINTAYFTRLQKDIGVDISGNHRIESTFVTEHHTNSNNTRVFMARAYDATQTTGRTYFSEGVCLGGGTPVCGLEDIARYGRLNQMYPLRYDSVFSTNVDQTAQPNIQRWFSLTPGNDADKRLGFNYSVNLKHRLVFNEAARNHNNHCEVSDSIFAIDTNGALLKAPYVHTGEGNFIRVTNEDVTAAHVTAEIFGESANGFRTNEAGQVLRDNHDPLAPGFNSTTRLAKNVYLGTVPAKSSVVFNIADIVRAAQEQEGYLGSDGGFATGSQTGFLANLSANATGKVNPGYNQAGNASRHSVTLTVTTEQNKAHAVTVQRMATGERVFPVLTPTKDMVFGQDGEPKLTFTWK